MFVHAAFVLACTGPLCTGCIGFDDMLGYAPNGAMHKTGTSPLVWSLGAATLEHEHCGLVGRGLWAAGCRLWVQCPTEGKEMQHLAVPGFGLLLLLWLPLRFPPPTLGPRVHGSGDPRAHGPKDPSPHGSKCTRIMDSDPGFVPWIRTMDSYHGFVSRIRIMDSYHGFVSQIRIMDLYHGFGSWVRIMGSAHGFGSWIRIMASE